MNQQPSTSDLAAILPTQDVIHIAGEAFWVRQIRVGQLTAVLKATQPLAGTLVDLQRLKSDGDDVDVAAVVATISKILVTHADDALALLAALSDKPIEWVNALEIDEAVDLFVRLLEVNISFFIQMILPKLHNAKQSLAEKIPAAQAPGPTPSTVSSKPATTTSK